MRSALAPFSTGKPWRAARQSRVGSRKYACANFLNVNGNPEATQDWSPGNMLEGAAGSS